jgi:hypothetical protein
MAPMDGIEGQVKALEVHQHYLRTDLESLASEVSEFRSAAWKLAIGAILTLGGLSLSLAGLIVHHFAGRLGL